MSFIMFQGFDFLFDEFLDFFQLREVELGVGEEGGEVAFRAVEVVGDDGLELALEVLRLRYAGVVFVVPAVGLESDESLSNQDADDRGYRGVRRSWLREFRDDILQEAFLQLPEDAHQLFFRFGQFFVWHGRM